MARGEHDEEVLRFPTTESGWESLWAPYDENTYQSVLSQIQRDDVVLDIGAGDLRLAIRMATIARKVYAIEKQKKLLSKAKTDSPKHIPKNLIVIEADARLFPFPTGVTSAVLLMRHCQYFGLYTKKLLVTGCQKLITNARWRFEPEVIDLKAKRMPYTELTIGWYACICGAASFKSGPVELLTPEIIETIFEVKDCPACPNMHFSDFKL